MNVINPILTLPALFQDQDVAFTLASPGSGGAELLVHAFSATETLFGLTQIDLELASTDPNIDLHELLDTPVTLTIHHKYNGLRHLSGVVAACSRGEEGHHHTFYSVTLLPALHRLGHGSECRIFQQKTVPDIIREVLKEYGIEDVAWDMSEPHEAREYCVQYRETHLAFIRRIAAEEGIWFYFDSGKEGQQTLKFIDSPKALPNLEDQPTLSYNGVASGAVKGVFCHRFQMREQLRATSFMQRDYSFKNPPYNQQHLHQKQEDNGSGADYKLYDFPGRYKAAAAGKPFTNHRMEAARVDATTGSGTTNAVHLTPGRRMAISDHPNAACNIKWTLLSVSHHGTQPQALGKDGGDGATTYSASFQAMPARLPYRPPQQAKPLVDGPQIAHVTGPAGEEIFCDEHGRVKVWFPWDHRKDSAKDDKTSCWIRVSQNWGGATWGHMAIPRIGHEVIVDFLEGDPDQPIITGRTYHQDNKPPNTLPDFKTRMVLKSDSHKGSGFNELRFEDEAGQEEVWMHAQKYHNVVIGDDQTQHLKANRHKRVDASQSESIGGSKDIEVGGLHRELIKGMKHLTVMAGFIRQIITGDFLRVLGVKSTDIAASMAINTGKDFRLETKEHQYFKIGKKAFFDAGEELVITAGKTISLNVGGNFVKISPAGVQIEGSLVKVNCGGSPPKGNEIDPIPVPPAMPYSGPHAERYGRSYEK